MTSSNLPVRFLGGLPTTIATGSRSNRAITRYETEGFVALQKEYIDQQCSFASALHGLALEQMLVDVGRVSAGGDPLKQQLAAMKIATFAECNQARLIKRFGGVR